MLNVHEILKSGNLSFTESRKLMLEILNKAERPLSGKEIEELIMGNCNRTTIYRNLNSFFNKDIVQRVISDDCIKYKLVAENNGSKKKPDHVHFQCRSCNHLICLESVTIKDYILPEGFSVIENQFLIFGICKDCNRERKA